MFRALFDIILNLMATLVQLVVAIPNALIIKFLPDISDKILTVTNTLNSVFNCISWGLGLIPAPIIAVLVFICTVEIAKHTVYISTHSLLRVWNLFQKVKFW